jgi:hypothetical protein
MNTVLALSTLWQTRPTVDAPPATVAAWYQAKGYLHEQIAAQGGPDEAAELAYAATAYDHARRLLAQPDRHRTVTAHDVVVPAQRTASVMSRQEARSL